MDFDEVVRRRRMVRRYSNRSLPPHVVDKILHNALQGPSAGFSQGTGFLVLDTPRDVARFRAATRPRDGADRWLATSVDAPLVIIPYSNKDAYLDRYALPDKGFTDRSDSWWPAPYWDIDAGMAALLVLLTAVDQGLGACFFALPKERIGAVAAEFGVPAGFTPVGAISVGYHDEPPADLRARRKSAAELIHRHRW